MDISKKIIGNIIGNKKYGGRNDWDGDGIRNKKDCQPRNTMRQDNFLSGMAPKSGKLPPGFVRSGYGFKVGDRVVVGNDKGIIQSIDKLNAPTSIGVILDKDRYLIVQYSPDQLKKI